MNKENISKALGVIGFIGLIVILLFLGPIVLMWLWPVVIPEVFPGAVDSGMIAEKLSFWQSVGLFIIAIILFKNPPNSSKEK